jgi:hypothetical protein
MVKVRQKKEVIIEETDLIEKFPEINGKILFGFFSEHNKELVLEIECKDEKKKG